MKNPSFLARVVGRATRLFRRPGPFKSSASYWDNRYSAGGNSGRGSYGELAEFKAEVLNRFVEQHGVKSVVEFGCGDGSQLRLARYPSYVGFDVSPTAIEMCRKQFANDGTKRFELVEEFAGETADLSMSLDVIYHLVEDEVYEQYMGRLCAAGRTFLAIYSSNSENTEQNAAPHVRHRRFTDWLSANRPEWRLMEEVKNPYDWNPQENTGSFADFYFFQRAGSE